MCGQQLFGFEMVGFTAPLGITRSWGSGCVTAVDTEWGGPLEREGERRLRTGGRQAGVAEEEASGCPPSCPLPVPAGPPDPLPLLSAKRMGIQEAMPAFPPCSSFPSPSMHHHRGWQASDSLVQTPCPVLATSTAHLPCSTSPPSIWFI